MLNVRLAGDHLFGKLLFIWLSLMVSMVMSFCAVLFPTRCLGWDLELNWVSFWGFSFLLLHYFTLQLGTFVIFPVSHWNLRNMWVDYWGGGPKGMLPPSQIIGGGWPPATPRPLSSYAYGNSFRDFLFASFTRKGHNFSSNRMQWDIIPAPSIAEPRMTPALRNISKFDAREGYKLGKRSNYFQREIF